MLMTRVELMQYIRVFWRHEHPDEPVELLSELDDARWEIRKVERYRDGSVGWADVDESAGSTRLGLVPVPALAEIALDDEFQVSEITGADFERAWILARPIATPRAVG